MRNTRLLPEKFINNEQIIYQNHEFTALETQKLLSIQKQHIIYYIKTSRLFLYCARLALSLQK